MKISCHPAAAAFFRWPKPGFALVVTLTLMILLTVIAVGLLSLSSISLRSSTQGQAMAVAQANARLALMLAIGELQKYAGADRAITATSEIFATPSAAVAKPNTTGVWETWWDFNPNSSPAPAYTTEKTKRFRRWLVSSADMAAAGSPNFVTTGWTGKSIELVGNMSIGADKNDKTPETNAKKVTAGLVPVSKNGKVQGSYAWHVSDESVKARINLYRDPNQNTTLAQKRALLAGHRPDPSVLKSSDGNLLTCLPSDLLPADFTKATASIGKIIDLEQAELLDQAEGKIKPFRNDITPYSLGVLADVRGGGLKQDLSSIFEMGSATSATLPADFTGKKLYESTHGITGVSDPYWSALAGYYNVFRNQSGGDFSITERELNPTFYQAPAQGVSLTYPAQPTSYYPGPVITKVEILYNLVVSNTLRRGDLGGRRVPYKGFMIYTPLVTLHNPYNINLAFYRMDVAFRNVPMAFRFYVKGQAQSKDLVPTDAYYLSGVDKSGNKWTFRKEKEFVMAIGDWYSYGNVDSSSLPATKIIMKPGQTLVCAPYLDPASGRILLGASNDYDNVMTGTAEYAVQAKPGFRGRCGGFLADCIVPSGYDGPPAISTDGASEILGFHAADMNSDLHIEFAMKKPVYDNPNGANGEFQVSAKLYASTGSTGSTATATDYGGLSFKYTPATLDDLFPTVYRYPHSGASKPSDFYVARTDLTLARAKTVAIFSAYARTINGGVYETGKRTETAGSLNTLLNGRLAGKPFLFHNPANTVVKMDLSTHKPGVESYELNLQPLPGHVDDILPIDNQNRSPAINANTETLGLKSAAYLELPTGPLQTIADFRRSNALTSPDPPHFVQPVANSLVSPLMSTDKVRQTDNQVSAAELLDHSVLANHALYDRFYFSTFATRMGSATADTETPEMVFEKFMNATTPLPSQAFRPYLPGGKSVAAAKAELYDAEGAPNDGAYKTAAEYQMVQGPFNVNSTSVQAWKAVLAAMNRSDLVTLWGKTNSIEVNKTTKIPILGMSLLNGGAIGAPPDFMKVDNAKTNDWNGHRELTDDDLETLATRIVEQVRTRGPFLSMSEFVNRRIGPNGPLTRCGALEAAITDSKINDNFFKANLTGSIVTDIALADIGDAKIYKYNTPEIVTGNPTAGAPGWVNQGDLLRILEPAATVRGDTFVIRSYGEAQDANGNITARAYAEAVVQRMPEYVDPIDRPSLNPYTDPTASAANKTFGRRINVVSFRWLTPNEI